MGHDGLEPCMLTLMIGSLISHNSKYTAKGTAHLSPYHWHHDLVLCWYQIGFGGYVMPRRRLSLPVSRATPFHIIYISKHQRQSEDTLGRVLPTALRPLPSSHQRTQNNDGRFFDPLLVTRYLFGISLCYRSGLFAAAVPGEGGTT